MKQLYSALLLILFCLTLAACSSKPKPQKPAEQYFLEGEQYFDDGHYNKAIESWELVRDAFYSPELSMLAELKIAEAYYKSEQYEEAAIAFDDFLKQHPNNERAPIILYRMGLSYYQQILSPDRDQTSTHKALHSFEELVNRFPDDQQAPEARNMILRCKTRLAEHEVYVGRFYLRIDQYQQAINRLEGVLKSFPQYYYRDEAYFYLGQAYFKTAQLEKGRETYDKLFKEFPGSKFIDRAQRIRAENRL
jgi:outer membrane protein assembly factor BamD